MAEPSIVGVTDYANASAPSSLSFPAGTQAGDLLILAVASASGSSALSGWTKRNGSREPT